MPTRGIERWLTQRLSPRSAPRPAAPTASARTSSSRRPRRLVGDAVAAASGIDPRARPVAPRARSSGRCSRSSTAPRRAVAARARRPPRRGAGAPDEARRARRLSTVRHIADLFDRYARPPPGDARARGRAGEPAGTPRRRALAGRAVAPAARAHRRARTRPSGSTAPARGCAPTRRSSTCPRALSLFGLTRLPAAHLEVLRALAAGARRPPVPAAPVAGAVGASRGGRRRPAGRAPRRRPDRHAAAPTALLASWGQDARELQLVLARPAARVVDHHHPVADDQRRRCSGASRPTSAPTAPPGAARPRDGDPRSTPATAASRSTPATAAPARSRSCATRSSTCSPTTRRSSRATSSSCAPTSRRSRRSSTPRSAPAQVADDDDDEPLPDDAARPTCASASPTARCARPTRCSASSARLLDLADGRLTASQVLDLADREPVRRRFRFDDDDLARIEDWVARRAASAGASTPSTARRSSSTRSTPGTWRAGLDRVLLGVAMTEDEQRLFGGVLPLDDVDSGAIDLAGRFAELVDRLRRRARRARRRRSRSTAGRRRSPTPPTRSRRRPPRDAWQRAELQRLLDDVVARGDAPARPTPTTLEPAGGPRAARRPPRRPADARELPHRPPHRLHARADALGAAPRRLPARPRRRRVPAQAARDGDDLVLDDPHVGDRDPRTEDRQLLLDALLAATDRLVVTYTGNDERTNVARPPAVPVGELLDVVDAHGRAGGRAARARARRRPPPAAAVRPAQLRAGRATPAGGRGASTRHARRRPRARPATAPPRRAVPRAARCPAPRADVVELEDLVRFVAAPGARVPAPAARHRRRRLRRRARRRAARRARRARAVGASASGCSTRGSPARRSRRRRRGRDRARDAAARAARRAGPRARAARRRADRRRGRRALCRRRRRAGARSTSASRSATAAGSSGTVPGVAATSLRARRPTRASRPKHRLAAWVRLLALTAAAPGRAVRGRDDRPRAAAARRSARRVTIAADRGRSDAATSPRAQLDALVDLRDRGLREPLPLACADLGRVRARRARRQGPRRRRARKQWESAWKFDGEDAQPEHGSSSAARSRSTSCSRERPRADEEGDGWDADEPTRFGRYARRLWDGAARRTRR